MWVYVVRNAFLYLENPWVPLGVRTELCRTHKTGTVRGKPGRMRSIHIQGGRGGQALSSVKFCHTCSMAEFTIVHSNRRKSLRSHHVVFVGSRVEEE